MKKLAVLSIFTVFVFSVSFTTSAMASDEEDVLQVVENWTEAYNASDMDSMSSLYSPDISIYTPPKSGAFLSRGWESLEKDLEPMFAMPEGTYSVSCYNTQAAMLDDSHAVITGYMIFTFNPPAVVEQTVALCRRTLVVQKIDGKWRIVHEHASSLPTE